MWAGDPWLITDGGRAVVLGPRWLGVGDKPGLVVEVANDPVGLIAAGGARCDMSFTERLCGSPVSARGLKVRCAIVRGVM